MTPGTKRELRIIGTKLQEARLRRKFPQSLIAGRASVSTNTIGRVEKGDLKVSIGAYAMVLQALGLLDGWGSIADTLGDELAEEQLRIRAPKESP